MSQKIYPLGSTSRTLDPSGKGFTTVVGKHDRRITDADINLIQDLQDLKRYLLTKNIVFSGALQASPFQFAETKQQVFVIPAFDVLFNGEVVTLGGFNSADLTINKVILPTPNSWSYGQTNDSASIFVVFAELWYQILDPGTGTGYSVDSNGARWIYAMGCIGCDSSNRIADDILDPFQKLNTTSRAQIQWNIRAVRVPLNYDFTQRRFGLDSLGNTSDTVFGQAFLSSPPAQSPSSQDAGYPFVNMGTTNGDFGLWRAGSGITGSSTPPIPTLDGYSYAIPLAVMFQRNLGVFDPSLNPNGCASSQIIGSGLLASGVSGRYDYKYADVVYSEDVVDTRLSVSLSGYDWDKLLQGSFVDLISGNMSQKIGRGEAPGADQSILGSVLPYTVTLGPVAIPTTDTIGQFDGFMNGFGADARTFYAVRTFSVNDKVTGVKGARWSKGDQIVVDLSTTNVRLGATVSYLMVQALVTQKNGSVAPVLLLSGQISTTPVGGRTITATFNNNLSGSAFDPGVNNLYVTIGVLYPAGSNYSLQQVPQDIMGGGLYDAGVNKYFPIFGVSEYETTRTIADQKNPVITYNPLYSNRIFGTRVNITIPATAATPVTYDESSLLQFQIPRNNINGYPNYNGLYIVGATNKTSGASYSIYYTAVDPVNLTVIIQQVPSTVNVVFSVLLNQTAQLSYNAAVKAVSSISETVLFGNYQNVSSSIFPLDPRIQLLSTLKSGVGATATTTLVFGTTNGTLTGVGGSSLNTFIFVADQPSTPTLFQAYPLLDVQFFNGVTTVIVPEIADIQDYSYFMVGAILPAFDSSSTLALTLDYLPYQGEGDATHTYTILHSEDFAMVTTNGTGAAPIVGLKDIYPFNRELPIITTLPAQPTWNDSDLTNQAVSNYFGNNYEAKSFNNVESMFITPLHTNDFIEPVSGWKRKLIQLSFPSGRGFAKVAPHVGFAITPPTPESSLATGAVTTVAPITLYVDNVHGNDGNNGLTAQTPKLTIYGGMSALPPILLHPCYIYLVNTGSPFSIQSLFKSGRLQEVFMGDGTTTPLASTVQAEGRLYIGRAPGESGYVTISASGYTPSDTPVSAFVINNSRVLFSGITFDGFPAGNPALYGVDAQVDFADCKWTNNQQAAGFMSSSIIVSGGSLSIGTGVGFFLSDSSMTSSGLKLIAAGASNAPVFYDIELTSNLTLENHGIGGETNITAATPVLWATLNSTVVCNGLSQWTSKGFATITSNSTLIRTANMTPFAGGVVVDSSSEILTDNSNS
jgi:hypothetical protein